MLREVSDELEHFYVDEQGRRQGEYKLWHRRDEQLWVNYFFIDNKKSGKLTAWYEDGKVNVMCFFVNDNNHGEYKMWDEDGKVIENCFFVNGREVSFDEIPYPTTDEERMLFMLKYDLQLLPVETKC